MTISPERLQELDIEVAKHEVELYETDLRRVLDEGLEIFATLSPSEKLAGFANPEFTYPEDTANILDPNYVDAIKAGFAMLPVSPPWRILLTEYPLWVYEKLAGEFRSLLHSEQRRIDRAPEGATAAASPPAPSGPPTGAY